MRLKAVIGILAMVLTLAMAGEILATNGDNLIGVGTASRAMGGVGIAAPQDAVTATFSNPAAMSFTDFDPTSQAGTSMTLFMPKVRAEIERADGTFAGDSAEKIYMIPSAAVSIPLSEASPHWRFGFGAYGVSGMGVNYRDVDVDDTAGYGYPVAAGTYTELSRMKVSPVISVRPLDWLAVGLGLQLHYASLDLDEGAKTGLAAGVQAGVLVKPTDNLSLGLTYVSSQEVEHKDVADFDGDGSMDNLDLASPQMFGLGLAWETPESDFLIEADLKWYNWSDATGYKDFDWNDQWVLALGAQYRPVDSLALRIGYNYAENPVDEHDDFVGANPVEVQGKFLPEYYYESFRIVGFPAIVEHHLTAGLAWSISDNFTLCLSYVHAFEKTITEEGTDLYGQPVTIRSKLSEDSLGLGLSYSF